MYRTLTLVFLLVMAGCKADDGQADEAQEAEREPARPRVRVQGQLAEQHAAQGADKANEPGPRKANKGAVPPPAKGGKLAGEKRFHIVEDRLPADEDGYIAKFGKRPPRGAFFCRPENRMYQYFEGVRLYWDGRLGAWIPGDPEE